MDYFKYIILLLVVLLVQSDAGGHEESHHDHVKLHVPEFIHHDHHTKVITVHHHHHEPKKEHHHHHHHHHKPHIIPYGPPKYHHTHHHSKSLSHTVSKGHTSVGKKSHGNHGLHGKHGHHGKYGHHHSGHDGHHSYKHHDTPESYDPPSLNYNPPTVNYAPPSINYSPSPSFGSDYSSFSPSVPNIPSPQVHGVVHTVQQVQVFDSLPGALKTGSTGYQVTEEGDEGEDVFTSVNSLSQSYPGTFGHGTSGAEQSNTFSDIAHSNSNQSPNSNPFSNAQPQPSYASFDDFKVQSQSDPSVPSVQPSYSEVTGYDNGDNYSVIGNDLSGASGLTFAEASQDDTPVTFSREAALQHAINTGGVETVAY